MANRKEAKEWAREKVKGLFTSPSIPFKEDLSLDEAGIRKNVDYMLKCKVTGLGFGFTEPWVCTQEERRRAMEVAIDAAKGKGVVVYVHATDHSVAETINLMTHAKNSGAEAVMVWTPYEWGKTQDMAYEYYEYIASKVDLGIFAYNTFHSGISLTPETLARIAKIPNICAIKDAIYDVNHVVKTMQLCGDQVVVSDPFEDHLLTMTQNFNQQVMLGTTSVYLMQSPHYQPIQDYYDLAKAGKHAEAALKYYELQPLRDIWVGMYTVLWEGREKGVTHPLAYIKYWMDLIGMAGGPLRPPTEQLTAEQKAAFKARLEASGWLTRLFPKK
jgi:4-hydroxy-tetrahydrodipicolinate synthase